MDPRRIITLLAATVLVGSATGAQSPVPGGGREDEWRGGSVIRMEDGTFIDERTVRTAREATSHSTGTPDWINPPGFEKDVFTFARVLFRSEAEPGENPLSFGWGRGPRLSWWVDFPDADLNFSYRLQQMTSIRTNPEGKVIRLTDADLTDYPFIYMSHPGYIQLRDAEVTALSKYLRNGGVLLVIDSWSTRDWDGFARQMKRVLPDRSWTELGIDHPIFHCVYNIAGPMQHLQVPTMQFWNPAHDPANPRSPPLQWAERGEGSEKMRVRALLDDKQRISVLTFHNSDISDGWEREGENREYFQKFSEKIAYPLGINIMIYLMTH
ncbi:MAG: DUF4159 domain-containing protein [Opitutaceae bacterium]